MSMSKPIKISYIWNRENINKLFEASYQYQFNNSMKRYIGWFFIALSQYATIVAIKKGAFELLLFSTIMLAYWYYGKKWIAQKRAEKSFEKSEFKDKNIEMTADTEGLTILKPHKEHWLWSELDEIVTLDEDIMLHKYPNFHYIPANGFSSIEEKSRFKKLAKENGKLR